MHYTIPLKLLLSPIYSNTNDPVCRELMFWSWGAVGTLCTIFSQLKVKWITMGTSCTRLSVHPNQTYFGGELFSSSVKIGQAEAPNHCWSNPDNCPLYLFHLLFGLLFFLSDFSSFKVSAVHQIWMSSLVLIPIYISDRHGLPHHLRHHLVLRPLPTSPLLPPHQWPCHPVASNDQVETEVIQILWIGHQTKNKTNKKQTNSHNKQNLHRWPGHTSASNDPVEAKVIRILQ